ncbi:DNA topoisomerase VI subunit B [Candidatus Woesearchaeota archaeon]|nr:DNA topoisomerase VI subunit B [Candidatus Woesearchaeota archaeon]
MSPEEEQRLKAVSEKAKEMASKQREISIAEFFEKNRHLLGFDNKRKALLTTIKEAVDNALDACEEASILPEIQVEIIDMENERFRVIVEDNGPGIVKAQIPRIFAKLLYGSKFHSLKQSRGQQGIGISASVMYGQLTTGRPAKITSKTAKGDAHYFELTINTKTNEPDIQKDEIKDWASKSHGTKVEIDLEGSYIKGGQSVDEYLKETAIINPHVTIIYQPAKGDQIIFPRATDKLPVQAKEIKPHPYGVELGILQKMLSSTEARTVKAFLTNDFSRVGNGTADEILEKSKILPKTKPKDITREMSEKLIHAIRNTKIMNPPTDCISPIGESLLEKGLKKEINAEFYCAVTRSPAVYRGNPFVIECAIAYGGELPKDKTVNVLRFANRVPLLFQQGACAITDSIGKTAWRSYGLNQSGNNLPVGPAVIEVHMASVWVPFTSEAKEALAHYPEIIKEIKLAVQEAGRKLMKYTAKKRRVGDELKKRSYIEKYLEHVAIGLQELLALDDARRKALEIELRHILEKDRGKLEDMEFDPSKNVDYDKKFASIGKGEENNDSSDEESEFDYKNSRRKRSRQTKLE